MTLRLRHPLSRLRLAVPGQQYLCVSVKQQCARKAKAVVKGSESLWHQASQRAASAALPTTAATRAAGTGGLGAHTPSEAGRTSGLT